MTCCSGASRLGAVLVLALVCVTASADDRATFTVGVVYDGPTDGQAASQRHLDLTDLISRETVELTRREFDVAFPERKRLSGAWSRESIAAALAKLVADPEVDVVLAMGTLASDEACRLTELPKTVIAPFAIDPDVQLLPVASDDEGRLISGVRNLNYLSAPGGAARDLRAFTEIANFSRIHIPVDAVMLEGIPQLLEFAKSIGEQLGLEYVLVPADESADELLDRLPPETEAVYVPPLSRFSEREFDRLIAGLIKRKLPSFSLIGRADVERGIMAGLRAATDDPRLARRVALNIQRTLLGEDAGTLPVSMEQQDRLTFNMGTVRAIDFSIRWRTLIDAELIHREGGLVPGRTISLDEAVGEALGANLSLRAKEIEVEVGRENVSQALSSFRPFVDAAVGYTTVDEDQAEISFGRQAEQTLDGSLQLSQLVYSDTTLANLSVARDLQSALEQGYVSLQLDIAVEAAVAFLEVLKTEALEWIDRENLRLTESNLDLARKREQIGYSGPADVYRWESELAIDRGKLIAAINRTRARRLALNRLMNRPQTERFDPSEPDIADPRFLSGATRLSPYLDSMARSAIFTEFIVREGLANSPEIRALDASIAAQERTSVAARRSFWAPEIGLFGAFEHVFDRSGSGSEPSPILGEVPDDAWSIGVSATLPLFTGGARRSLLRQSNEELSRLRVERANLAQSIELRVRLGMTRVNSTFPAIDLAREAADAATRNLDLVTDSYSRGVLSIIDLLDAQSATLVAEQSASNAIYDFFIDLMELQRAANSIGFLMSEAGREAWYDRLDRHFEEATAGTAER